MGEKGRRSPQKKKKKKIKERKKEEKRKIKNGITTQKNKTREKVKWEKPRQNGQNGIILTHKPVIIFSLIIQKICFGCSKNRFLQTNGKCNNALIGRGYFFEECKYCPDTNSFLKI